MSKVDMDEFVGYEVPEGAHVLSVYLQTHSAESESVLQAQLKEIERRFEAESEQREFDESVQRVRNFLSRFEARAPMLVLFCTATGSMWTRQIEVLLPNLVRWDRVPYWKPLVEAVNEFEPYGVLLLDGSKARLCTAFLGKIHEHLLIERGSSERLGAYLNRVIDGVRELSRTEWPPRMIVAGDRKTEAQLLKHLPADLRRSTIGTATMNVDAPLQEVLETTRKVDEFAERRFEIKQVDQLLRLAEAHKRVTLGLRNTIDALNDGCVWRLVYSENFAARGGHCILCNSDYATDSETCKKCHVAIRPSDDLVAAVIVRALNSDASIEQVRGEAAVRLDRAGGIGSFLRW